MSEGSEPTPSERREHEEANRRTAPVFVVYLLVLVLGIGGAIAIGFIREEDDAAAGNTVERFVSAFEKKDGVAACAQLTNDTLLAVEAQEKQPCRDGILSLDLKGGKVTRLDVSDKSAVAALSEGERVYLDETDGGWRIAAAGCKPVRAAPDDCELED